MHNSHYYSDQYFHSKPHFVQLGRSIIRSPAASETEITFRYKQGSTDSVSYPRVNSWACQWDSRVSRSHTKTPRPRVSHQGLSQESSTRESEGLVRCRLTPGLVDRQPVPPTTSGACGTCFQLSDNPESNQADALLSL